MDLLLKMIEHHVWLIEEMIDRAATLPDETLDAEIEISVEGIDDHPTLRSLLSRLVGQMDMWNCAIAMRDYDWVVENHEALDAMRERLSVVAPVFMGHVSEAAENGRLDETFVDALCEPPEVFTYGGMIAHVLTFAAHRRTLVAGALESAGVNGIGSGDPMRWVAQNA